MQLYIFNPEHDLALANGNPYFDVPRSAKQFSTDLAALPLWYAEPNSLIFCTKQLWQIPMLTQNKTIDIIPHNISEVIPWGWNNMICNKLSHLGMQANLLPNDILLSKIRQQSHRKLASKAAAFLQQKMPEMPNPAKVLTTLESVRKFATEHEEIVLKSPWSGSGKGLYWCRKKLTASLEGWCHRIIAKQGCVMGEVAYNKIVDFAMEFKCNKKGDICFAGYSLFHTENGIYKNNILADNTTIEDNLTHYISSETLHTIKTLLMQFFTENLSNYSGYFGVDMLIFKRIDGSFGIYPTVEINLRMTMGMVARLFYDRFVVDGTQGEMRIDHITENGNLLADDADKKIKYPLTIIENRIQKGYLSLCPITEGTHYRACVIIH
ncbi:MAG: hypothetical protein PHH23_02990 [Paludibacteraceae bacterium]|jgi:hypothetical protein|nr:hypothetical protein [Paludibacteraceae bacterium]